MYAVVKEFLLKFAPAKVILCAFSSHCYFSFAKMIRVRLQKRNAAAVVINNTYKIIKTIIANNNKNTYKIVKIRFPTGCFAVGLFRK